MLSDTICMSKTLICGPGSTMWCGLLGFSTRTPVLVSGKELATWPEYMHDFKYADDTVHAIETNHRLLFDRHTIRASDPLLRRFYQKQNERGFNIYQYDCKAQDDKTRPIASGNMGDVFPSHIGAYFADQMHLDYYVDCINDKTSRSRHSLSIALIGSIARISISHPRTVLLGVGIISENALKKAKMNQGVYVMGVRGTRSRDAFLKKFGKNPEVVGDPGLWLGTIFETQVIEARLQNKMKELCFISHHVDTGSFDRLLPQYKDVTVNAKGDLETIVKFLATCRHTVSSSLHGAIFSHALSIPTAVIQISNRLVGGDEKFYDYYYGMNLTTFDGRHRISNQFPESTKEWLELVNQFPQPAFPFNAKTRLTTFELFKSIFEK